MLTTTIPVAAAAMILLPIVLAVAIVRGLGTPARLVLWGAATFLLAQALRLPLLQGLTAAFQSGTLPAPDPAYHAAFNVAVLSLTAGLFEEGARFLAYRYAVPDARSWNAAVTLGAGHGGIESILLGGLMGIEFVSMATLGAPGAAAQYGLGPEEQARLAGEAARYWALPWYMPLLGAAERVFSLCFHLTMAVVVLRAVVRRNPAWLIAAIGAHAAANATGAAVLAAYGPVAAEAAIGLIAALALFVLFGLRRRDQEAGRAAI